MNDAIGTINIRKFLETKSAAASIIATPNLMLFQLHDMKQKYKNPMTHAVMAPDVLNL